MPVWLDKIDLSDVFHNDGMSFEEKRDAIVQRLRESDWFQAYGDDSLLGVALNNIAGAMDVEDFDSWWDDVYDVADRDRVWIETR